MDLEFYRSTALELLRKDERTYLERLVAENWFIDQLVAMGADENEVLHFVASVEEKLY